MKKKQVAYILIALGAVAAVVYYLSSQKTDEDTATDDGNTSNPDKKTRNFSDDAGTYNKLMGLVPVANRRTVANLASSRFVSGYISPWFTASGAITQTGAFMSAYLHYYGVSAAETNNRIKAFQIWDEFKARN